MKKIIILLAVLLLMIAETAIAARYNYTWKDADGGLNITDYPPPEDAELLDVRVIPMPETKEITPTRRQNELIQEQNETRKRLLLKAESLKEEEARLRQRAAELIGEAGELRRISKKLHYKSRHRLRAAKKEEEAEELLNRADSLSKEAETLELEASGLTQ